MPTASEAARAEAEQWAGLAAACAPDGILGKLADTPPAEQAVVVFFDPSDDLSRRGGDWGYEFSTCDLSDVGRFGAGLAQAEADAWSADTPDIATRAYAERRFLLSDRVLHWAVPWLDTVGRCYPELRDEAHPWRDVLLDLGDRHRPAPKLATGEGLFPPGSDAYGPLDLDRPLAEMMTSLWSGAVILREIVRSMSRGRSDRIADNDLADPDTRVNLAVLYEAQAARWGRVASTRPGSAALWSDLALRAQATRRRLS